MLRASTLAVIRLFLFAWTLSILVYNTIVKGGANFKVPRPPAGAWGTGPDLSRRP